MVCIQCLQNCTWQNTTTSTSNDAAVRGAGFCTCMVQENISAKSKENSNIQAQQSYFCSLEENLMKNDNK